MIEDTLGARSLAALAERFPALATRIEREGGTNSEIVFENGVAVDIKLDGRDAYGGDARSFAATQVAAFMERPLRLFMNEPDAAGIVSPICVALMNGLAKHVAAQGVRTIASRPINSPTYLVLFGLGLGYHLEELLERTGAKWLIIAEPRIDFLGHSLGIVDWPALFARVEDGGGRVEIVTEIDPRRMVTDIARFMHRSGMPYVDGAWVFSHYPSWAFAQARARLYEAVEFAFVNRGFFEDELRMIENAVANFAQHDFWLLEGIPRRQRAETAVIVGAGPSLDEAIEVLHRIRDRVVLFSGGTALRPLLRAGITPDFHCELENVPEVFGVLSDTALSGDLSQITLIASATVDPRVPGLFGKRIFYFRDTVVSTPILGRGFREVPLTSPTCVNTALGMAGTMGFREVLMFGTDCGVRADGADHASGSAYELERWSKEQSYPMEVEGNFGGVAKTNWVYDACRQMLGQSIHHWGFHIANCSDGALIPGATPLVPEAVSVTTPPIDRAAFVAEIDRTMRRFTPGRILDDIDLEAVARKAEEMFDALDREIETLGQGAADFAVAFEAMQRFASEAEADCRYGSTNSIVSGSLRAMPRLAMFFGFRIADAAMRRELHALFIREFQTAAAKMRVATAALFERIGALEERSVAKAS